MGNIRSEITDNQLSDLLERIRRINVMLWAFDYVAAEIELDIIYDEFGTILDNAKEEESKFRQIKYQVEENERSRIRSHLSSTGIAGERLQVQTQREIIDKATAEAKRIGFDSSAMSLSGLASIISIYVERVEQAKKITKDQYEKARNDRLGFEKTLHTETFLHSTEKSNETHTIYRAYRLGQFQSISVTDLQQRLQIEFQTQNWSVLSNTQGYPIKLRTFLSNAMVTLVAYDTERYRLEITHDVDSNNLIARSIAEQIQGIMSSLGV